MTSGGSPFGPWTRSDRPKIPRYCEISWWVTPGISGPAADGVPQFGWVWMIWYPRWIGSRV